jgi:hypothetical protein
VFNERAPPSKVEASAQIAACEACPKPNWKIKDIMRKDKPAKANK